MGQKLLIILAAMSFSSSVDLLAQSYPDWGPWWNRPEPHGFGGEAEPATAPMSPDQQIQQKQEEESIQQKGVDNRLQQRNSYNRSP